MSFINLKKFYKEKKAKITKRLSDFIFFYNNPYSWFYDPHNGPILKKVKKEDNERYFEEMCFCILAANGTAISAMKGVDSIRNSLYQDKKTIQFFLKKSGVRFHNRAEYIVYNRRLIKNLKNLLESNNLFEVREILVNEVKGFGYKEASHFLRNLGFFGLAILDKHILRSMVEFNIIKEIPKILTKKRYLELETKFIKFSKKINIDMNELDLLLWARKTGKILK